MFPTHFQWYVLARYGFRANSCTFDGHRNPHFERHRPKDLVFNGQSWSYIKKNRGWSHRIIGNPSHLNLSPFPFHPFHPFPTRSHLIRASPSTRSQPWSAPQLAVAPRNGSQLAPPRARSRCSPGPGMGPGGLLAGKKEGRRSVPNFFSEFWCSKLMGMLFFEGYRRF